MDTSNPLPPDDEIGPRGPDYQRRNPDDGVPPGGPVDPPADDGSPAGNFPAAGQGDTADVIDPEAPDPEPAAVQPWDADWVDPDVSAAPVDRRLLHAAIAALADGLDDGLDVPPDLLGGGS